MRVWRWPVLLVLIALVAGAVWQERRPVAVVDHVADISHLMPAVPAPDSFGSTWYCAGGTADGEDGSSDHSVVVSNGSDKALRGTITAYPSEGDSVAETISLEPYSVRSVLLDEIVEAPHVAALIEVHGGEVSVQHEVRGSTGRAVGACAVAPATSWYFPAGTTRAGAGMVLSVFNPFPSDAVLDISFETDDGSRTPQAFQGLVVPGGRVVAINVSDVVTLREEVATTIEARSGRVVVNQIQEMDGTDGTARGLTVTLGANAPAPAWVFPDGVGVDQYSERFVLLNPSDEPAEVDVAVMLDDPDINGFAEPFDVRVPAHRSIAVDVFGDGRVPPGVAHETLVTSRNGVEIVAEREIVGSSQAVQPGVSYTIGSPVTATRWIAAVGSTEAASGAALIVANPSATLGARVVVRIVRNGIFRPIKGMDGVDLPPGGRQIFDLSSIDVEEGLFSVEVGSDNPVVAETRFGFSGDFDLTYLMAAPVSNALAPIVVDDIYGGMSSESFVVGE